MKSITLIMSFWISLIGFSQDEIDIPVLKIESPCINLNRIISFDSTSNTETRIEVLTIDRDNPCIPGDYTITIRQQDPVPYYLLAFARCGEDPYEVTYRSPDTCMYYQKASKDVMISSPIGGTSPDSILLVYNYCCESFYQIENDSIRSDTVYAENYIDDNSISNDLLLWSCDYFYKNKHGQEFGYYNVLDVQGICITGKKPMLRYEGYWNYGKKNSWWVYYQPNGEIERVEKYRNGKLKKSEIASR
ncbi:MAG: hypothetical protein ACI8ZM_001497 [Crocinitomix sp.]|jgi:hypothetical protein